jgi:hypothetical protein
MRAYVGQTRSSTLIDQLNRHGIGEATQPDEWPPRRVPYFFDNGAFKLWTAGQPFDEARFLRVVERIDAEGPTPDFIVAPDRVADPSSLEYSVGWLARLRGVAPLALVVQDGMVETDVKRAMQRGFTTVFVGGTLAWKFATAPAWVRMARDIGAKCHIGRIGTRGRARWAREIGAHSVDSCTPLFSRDNLSRWLEGLRNEYQGNLFGPPPPAAREHGIIRKNKRKETPSDADD